MSRVDVVVPCYNYGKFLADCVAGALDDQPGTDVRVLIIDDASQDDSAEIAQKLAATDDRVDVIVHPVNRGHIATFNEGLLDWADGDYCILISADDKLTPGALRRAADLMDAHPEVGFVYGNVVGFRDGEELPPSRTTTPALRRSGPATSGLSSASGKRIPASSRRRSWSGRPSSIRWAATTQTCTTHRTSRCGCGWPPAPMWDSSTQTRLTSAGTTT